MARTVAPGTVVLGHGSFEANAVPDVFEGPHDQIGGDVQIDQIDDLVVTSLHAPPASQYARPATSGPTPR